MTVSVYVLRRGYVVTSVPSQRGGRTGSLAESRR